MTPNVAQIVELIEEVAPREMSVVDDPVGLQCGETNRPVRSIMFALDASAHTVDQALAAKSDLLVTHHPLLFKPLGQGMEKDPAGNALIKAVRGNLAVYSAHTNLDASPDGINRSLANLLRLSEVQVLCPTGASGGFKLVVYVPVKDLAAIREAVFKAGGGRVGNYSSCSFTVEGVGTFLGDEGTSPAVGTPGILEKVREARLEILVPDTQLRPAIDIVREKHPYEEPVIDVYPLIGQPRGAGMGLKGMLPARMSVGEIAAGLKKGAGGGSMRLVGSRKRKVRQVALCAGSGAALMGEAIASGAELFITGDVKYHEARTAEVRGLTILDVGHFGPERYGMIRFGELMAKKFKEKGWEIRKSHAKEKDPFSPAI